MNEAAFAAMGRESGNWVKRGRQRLIRHLIRSHAPRGELRILDIGAGHGGNVGTLAELGVVDAVECMPGAERLGAHPDIEHFYAESVPFDLDRQYEVICAAEVLEHIDDDRAAMRWVFDHLVPGGLFIATVPGHPWLYGAHDRAVGHVRRYTRRELLGAMPAGSRIRDRGWFVWSLAPAAIAARSAWEIRSRLAGSTSKQQGPRRGRVDRLLGGVLDLELSALELGFRAPVGYSLFIAASREGPGSPGRPE